MKLACSPPTLLVWLVVVVANTQIQRQLRTDLPVILRVSRVIPLGIDDVRRVRDVGVVCLACEKIGDIVSRIAVSRDAGVHALSMIGAAAKVVLTQRCRCIKIREADGLEGRAELERVVAEDLGDVVQYLKDVLGFVVGADRAPLLDATLREVAERQAILSGPEIRHSTQSQRGSNRRVIGVGLLVRGVVPVVTEAELIGQRRGEDVSLAEHEVLREDEVALAAVATAIQDRTKRKSVQNDVVQVAVARIGLVLGADIPVHALVPLNGVVGLGDVLHQVAVGFAAVGVRRRIHVQDLQRDRIDLARTEGVGLPVAGKRPRDIRRVRLIERDRALAGEIAVEQLGEVALPHQCRWRTQHIGLADGDAIRFNIAEVEELVLPDGETERGAELVLVIGRD